MVVEGELIAASFGFATDLWLVPRAGIIILAILYFIFSLIVARQINLMAETLITEAVPYLKAFAIIHSGLALGVIILFIGFLFG